MAYTIYKADGTGITVPDNTIDTAYYNPTGGGAGNGNGIQLIGRNAIDYGTAIAQNILQMTQSFASPTGTFPSDATALQGQLWFDTTQQALYVRSTTAISGGIVNWQKLLTVAGTQTGTVPIVNPTLGTENDGDTQIITSPSLKVSIYANGGWQQVFPAVYS